MWSERLRKRRAWRACFFRPWSWPSRALMTSSSRSRLVSAARSRSSASWRRRMQPGDAGGLFQELRAVRGLGVDHGADPALADQGGRVGAGRRIGEQQLDVAGPDLASVDPVGRAVAALDPALNLQLVMVVELSRRRAVAVVEEDLHFGDVARRPAGVPEKITSSMPPPRMRLAESSPMTQRRASTKLDLPQPFGPTIPVRPRSIQISVGSTKDLNPVILSFENCTKPTRASPAQPTAFRAITTASRRPAGLARISRDPGCRPAFGR